MDLSALCLQLTKGRPLAKEIIAVYVGTPCDVKRPAGRRDNKRVQRNVPWQRDTSEHAEVVPGVERGAAVLSGKIICVRRRTSGAVCIALRVAQPVIT